MMKHSHSIPVFGVYPGPIDTDMKGIYTNMESSANVAIRVFDGMERGIIDITTDALSDNFVDYLRTDPKIIDALNPSDDLVIYKAFYPFGAKISQDGILYLPSEGDSVIPIHSSFISKEIQNSFKRRSIPLSLVAKHNSEVFYD